MNKESKEKVSKIERTKQIVAIGREVFLERGFNLTSKEIATRIGISETMVFKIFPSKKAIIEAIYHAHFQRKQFQFTKEASENFRSELVEYFKDFYRGITGDRTLEMMYRFGLEETSLRPDPSMFFEYTPALIKPLENYLESGIQHGYFKKCDVKQAANFIHNAFFHFIFFHSIFLKQNFSEAELNVKVVTYVDFFIQGIEER